MRSQLSRRAWVWVMGLLLAGAGLLFLVVWALSPDGKRETPSSAEGLSVSEVVTPVAKPVQAELPTVNKEDTQPAAQPVRLAVPNPVVVARSAEAPKDGGLAKGEPLKKMRGLIKWMSGTVGTAPENPK